MDLAQNSILTPSHHLQHSEEENTAGSAQRNILGSLNASPPLIIQGPSYKAAELADTEFNNRRNIPALSDADFFRAYTTSRFLFTCLANITTAEVRIRIADTLFMPDASAEANSYFNRMLQMESDRRRGRIIANELFAYLDGRNLTNAEIAIVQQQTVASLIAARYLDDQTAARQQYAADPSQPEPLLLQYDDTENALSHAKQALTQLLQAEILRRQALLSAAVPVSASHDVASQSPRQRPAS